jgi:hypothetical protein
MVIQVTVWAAFVSMGTSRLTAVGTHSVERPLLNERSPVRRLFRCNSANVEVGGGGACPRSSLRSRFESGWTSKVKHCAWKIAAEPHLVCRPHQEAEAESS